MGNVYWFAIVEDERARGGAFLVSRKYALTATHCLGANPRSAYDSDDPTRVSLLAENGTQLTATVCQVHGDLALLEVLAYSRHEVLPPSLQSEAVSKDSAWQAPYRPDDRAPTLSGTVGNPNLVYQCADGSRVLVLQLTVMEEIGTHSGYSGGPVAVKLSDDDNGCVAGVLLEEFPDRADPKRAANVVFAARLQPLFTLFQSLDPTLNLLGETTGPGGTDLPAGDDEPIEKRLSDGRMILSTAREWADQGYLNEGDYTEYKSRVRDIVFAEGSRR